MSSRHTPYAPSSMHGPTDAGLTSPLPPPTGHAGPRVPLGARRARIRGVPLARRGALVFFFFSSHAILPTTRAPTSHITCCEHIERAADHSSFPSLLSHLGRLRPSPSRRARRTPRARARARAARGAPARAPASCYSQCRCRCRCRWSDWPRCTGLRTRRRARRTGAPRACRAAALPGTRARRHPIRTRTRYRNWTRTRC